MSDPEDFKTHLSGVFSRASSAYDHTGPRFFSYFGKKLVEFAGIPPGARVLDVACGRGAVFIPASTAVSATGQVIGIDLAEGMIEQARHEVSLQGLANTEILQMDAERLDFPDASFDFVLCGLCLFFFPNLDQALTGFLRVLKPGGRLVASTFQAVEDDAKTKRWNELYDAYKDCLKPVPDTQTKKLNTEAEIKQTLSQEGFSEIEVVPQEKTFYFDSEKEWWQATWSHGGRGFLERMEADVIVRYQKQATELIREEKTEQGIPDTWRLFYSKAQKPS
jgi:ubiquinone/menaquinone biosynthesis C-methylase UbiE